MQGRRMLQGGSRMLRTCRSGASFVHVLCAIDASVGQGAVPEACSTIGSVGSYSERCLALMSTRHCGLDGTCDVAPFSGIEGAQDILGS
jgi:hypothetical protein